VRLTALGLVGRDSRGVNCWDIVSPCDMVL
jgi:hypothetical protein